MHVREFDVIWANSLLHPPKWYSPAESVRVAHTGCREAAAMSDYAKVLVPKEEREKEKKERGKRAVFLKDRLVFSRTG